MKYPSANTGNLKLLAALLLALPPSAPFLVKGIRITGNTLFGEDTRADMR